MTMLTDEACSISRKCFTFDLQLFGLCLYIDRLWTSGFQLEPILIRAVVSRASHVHLRGGTWETLNGAVVSPCLSPLISIEAVLKRSRSMDVEQGHHTLRGSKSVLKWPNRVLSWPGSHYLIHSLCLESIFFFFWCFQTMVFTKEDITLEHEH